MPMVYMNKYPQTVSWMWWSLLPKMETEKWIRSVIEDSYFSSMKLIQPQQMPGGNCPSLAFVCGIGNWKSTGQRRSKSHLKRSCQKCVCNTTDIVTTLFNGVLFEFQVKSIYVRNLTAECTDQNLREYFSKYGEIESIKKVRDFAFIHFKDRASAISALDVSNKTVLPNDISNGTIDVELVKPNINSQYKSVGFSFSNLLTPPFLSYPYGLPIPPPPAHLLPPPHLMYGMTSPSHLSLSNKNRRDYFLFFAYTYNKRS